MKNKNLVITAACLVFILAISSILILSQTTTISQKDFPLEIDLGKKVFTLGEKISFNATITNKSGKDVNMFSNGYQPWAVIHNINDNSTFAETSERVDQVFKANEKITQVYEFEFNETGTYILEANYNINVNEVRIQDKINDIVIEIK
jgi:hypothetical protein